MALYFLDYDIRSRNHDYQPLYDELAKFSAVRMLDSLWCFKRFNTTAAQLRDYFQRLIHPDDSLCVSEVADWGTWNTKGNPNQLPP
jgi:hypothetical protein